MALNSLSIYNKKVYSAEAGKFYYQFLFSKTATLEYLDSFFLIRALFAATMVANARHQVTYSGVNMHFEMFSAIS